MTCCSWAGPATTATRITSSLRSSPARQSKSGTNFARYCDPALDKLISAGKTTSEQGVRSKLYQQAQAQIQQQALWLPLAHPTAFALDAQECRGLPGQPVWAAGFLEGQRQALSCKLQAPLKLAAEPCKCWPLLHPAVFRHRQRITIAHDDVIQHPHIHHLQGLFAGLWSISDQPALGSTLPEGWLWHRINAAAL